MADDKKRGFWGRLFGSSEPAKPEPSAPSTDALTPEAPEQEVLEPTPADPATIEPTTAEASLPDPVPETAEPVADVAPVAEVAPIAAPIAQTDPTPTATKPEPKASWWQRLKTGLSRTSSSLTEGITSIFTKRKLDAETLEELEDTLIQADLGLAMASRITEALKKGRYGKEISEAEVRGVLAAEVEAALKPVAVPLTVNPAHKPHVILVVGVNGTGKTTTIGKLASKFSKEGKSLVLAAGDTFRAAAIEQLKIWGGRTGAPVIAREPGADAAGLAFDALKEAKASGADVLIIDTAGRLQNKTELMAELEKIVRVLKKQDPDAPHQVLLTLDATTGQNALNQVEIFGKVAGVTGLVMTKLDGTARGGILVAIAAKHALPVHFIGVGEGIDDLEPFDASDFAKAIAGLEK